MSDALLTVRDDAILHLRLNRPQIHNAFDDALIQELTHALQAAGAQKTPHHKQIELPLCFKPGARHRIITVGAQLLHCRGNATARCVAPVQSLKQVLHVACCLPCNLVKSLPHTACGGAAGIATVSVGRALLAQ